MKKTIMLLIISIVFLIPAVLLATSEQTGNIQLTITGFENTKGLAKIALVNSEKNYDAKKPFKGYDCKIVSNQVIKTLPSLPYGEYAIKVFHDENDNDKLDTKIFGIPSESYGFSNNVRGKFGPPDFKEARFELNRPEVTMEIEVR